MVYDSPMKNFLGVLAVIAVVIVLIFTFTSGENSETLESTPHSVYSTSGGVFTHPGDFVYVDSDRQKHELTECEGFWNPRSCETVDGDIRFEYSLYKGAVKRDASVTVNGEKLKLTCAKKLDNSFQYGCMPVAEGN